MKYFFMSLFFSLPIMAYNLGSIIVDGKTEIDYKLASDMSDLLEKYEIDSNLTLTVNSYENLENLHKAMEENSSKYFSIIQKDAIKYYNSLQYELNQEVLYEKLPVVLSLGEKQIHIISNKNNEFNFETQKEFSIYCGEKNSNSCISAQYIEKAYDFNFTYNTGTFYENIQKLKDSSIDLLFLVDDVPSNKIEALNDIKLVDLPTNFEMEKMYTHFNINSSTYSFLDEDIHTFAVSRALVTNLSDDQYAPVIESIIKIIMLNKELLVKKSGQHWENIDFYYTKYKKMAPNAKKTIESIGKFD